MDIKAQLTADLKSAMKAKDQAALRSIRAIKSAIQLHETQSSDASMSEEEVIKLLQKLVKQRQESLGIYTEQGREDLAQTEREEIEVIERYLPAQLDAAELGAIVDRVIEAAGATSMKDMGAVMGKLSAEVAGRADGKTLAALVKERLG